MHLELATASWDRFERDPLGALWLPIDSERRVRLLDLPITGRGSQGRDAPHWMPRTAAEVDGER